jgi:hypothetical protein
MKVPYTKTQDLGQSKYKLRLFLKRTHGISKILFMNPWQAWKAKLEVALFLGIHNCKKKQCDVNQDEA